MSYEKSLIDSKQDELISGTNIKTINGSSILGSGDLVVTGGGGITAVAVVGANGITGASVNTLGVANLTLALGAITPTSTNGVVISGTSTPTLAVTGTTSVSGTNTGDQTSIVGITGTKAEFDTAVTDGNFVFVGDAVLNPEGWNVIVKSANQDVTNNATLQDDTDLQFSVVAGGHYMVSLDLTYSGNNSTGDYKCAFAVSLGTIKGYGTSQSINISTSIINIIITAVSASATNALAFGVTNDIEQLVYAKFNFSFTASDNATFKYQFANNASGIDRTSRTWKGSILKYKRID